MIYITDSNTDSTRPIPESVEWMGDDTVIAQLGSIMLVVALQSMDTLPGWQKFAATGEGDAETVAMMIEECEDDEMLKERCLEGLKVAIPPIFVTQDTSEDDEEEEE